LLQPPAHTRTLHTRTHPHLPTPDAARPGPTACHCYTPTAFYLPPDGIPTAAPTLCLVYRAYLPTATGLLPGARLYTLPVTAVPAGLPRTCSFVGMISLGGAMDDDRYARTTERTCDTPTALPHSLGRTTRAHTSVCWVYHGGSRMVWFRNLGHFLCPRHPPLFPLLDGPSPKRITWICPTPVACRDAT